MRQSTAPASALFSWWRMEMGGDCLHPPEQRGSLEGKEEELLPSSRTVVVGGLRYANGSEPVGVYSNVSNPFSSLR